ncbi:MAG: Fe-S cluster assembly protein SufD [Muribaculaceae bacterium]|nr:Fe-S cluster assembly protein SufD [Muribaculaceae bacterium]
MNALKQYIDLFDEYRDLIEAQSPALLNTLRISAREQLETARLPRKGSEDYEATNLEEVFSHDYGVNLNRLPFDADPGETFHCDVPNMSTCLYYSSNDAFHSSPTAERNIGQVVVEPFSMAAVDYPELMTAYFGKLAHMSDPTVALNSLLVQDGLFIYVPDGVIPEPPIQLVNIFNAALDMMVQRRLLIVVGKNAALKLLACDHTQSPDYRYLNNQVVEIVAMQGATVDYYDMEESTPLTSRVSSIYVDQHEGSNVLIDGITLINGFTRNNYHVEVNGEHAETHLLGMTIASGEQHVDSHTFISHNAPRCNSNEMFKYVLNDKAVGAFAGKILVKPNCPRVEAYQGNRNLCGAPTAKMYTKPQLEIYTDDVMCSHGSAIGQLDEDALFYMRTRGIGIDEARRLLMQAFVADVIDGVRLDVLKDRLHFLVEKRFAGTLSNCAGCMQTCRPNNNNQ